MDLQILSQELASARRRLANQEEQLQLARQGLAMAVKDGMRNVETAYRARAARVEKAVALSSMIVQELEGKIGTLDLSPPKPRGK